MSDIITPHDNTTEISVGDTMELPIDDLYTDSDYSEECYEGDDSDYSIDSETFDIIYGGEVDENSAVNS
jgi:hypothetical protein